MGASKRRTDICIAGTPCTIPNGASSMLFVIQSKRMSGANLRQWIAALTVLLLLLAHAATAWHIAFEHCLFEHSHHVTTGTNHDHSHGSDSNHEHDHDHDLPATCDKDDTGAPVHTHGEHTADEHAEKARIPGFQLRASADVAVLPVRFKPDELPTFDLAVVREHVVRVVSAAYESPPSLRAPPLA